MKTAQVRSLGKDLLPQLPGYSHKELMLYANPLNHVLRGFYFEDSGFDPSAFYVWAFFLPLYVPATHLSFNFGKRFGEGSGKRWNLSDPRLRDELLACIQRDGLPFLESVKQPCDVATAIHRLGADSDPYKHEAIAYSLAMALDVAAAQQALERLTKSLDQGVAWQAEMGERATQLAQKMGVDPQEARSQLAEWEQATVKNLGLR
jgi:hypothetical protein